MWFLLSWVDLKSKTPDSGFELVQGKDGSKWVLSSMKTPNE